MNGSTIFCIMHAAGKFKANDRRRAASLVPEVHRAVRKGLARRLTVAGTLARMSMGGGAERGSVAGGMAVAAPIRIEEVSEGEADGGQAHVHVARRFSVDL